MSFPDNIPGRVRMRDEVPRPAGYAVFDCETTGMTPGLDEIVSFAVVRLDADAREVARLTRLVRPAQPIPAGATAVHGISDEDVRDAPRFADIAAELLVLLDGAVFVAHNASFDLGMLETELRRFGVAYRPPAVACTLRAYQLLEPLEPAHNLEALCSRHEIHTETAHEALADAEATVELLRLLLVQGFAPETVDLDASALWRMRSRGDMRPATPAQIRRVFALGYAAGLATEDIVALVARTAGTAEVDELNREQVQDVYDALGEAA
jgi:DNA polymerase III epsilon subunit family exonuclease